MKNRPKALVLFSGGLDSVITVKLLQEQNIDVTALFIQNGFRTKDTTNYLIGLTEKLNVDFININKEEDFFNMWKDPSFGYGKAVNPCINCHALMANVAEQYRVKHSFDFIATGDVLEQRGFSQTTKQLKKVISIIDNPDKILRPLSAHHLKKTEMESIGLVDRDMLLGITGKSRRIQYKLLKKYGLNKKDVESPAGGCLMAETDFKDKIIDQIKKIDFDDFHIMKYGRHITINNHRMILSRNTDEHKQMLKYSGENFLLLETNNLKSPIAFIDKNYFDENDINDILNILMKYSKFNNQKDKLNFSFNENTFNRIKHL
jgi:tRNA-specific 2-thiouridylase